MNSYMEDDLPNGSFDGLLLDKILVDAFRPKFGYEKDLVVFSFFVKQRDAANKLMNYIIHKNFDLLDVEVSPNPKPDSKPDTKKDWKYILFIEMNRNKDMFATMDKLLLHIDHLVSIKQWYFRASAYKEYMDWDRGNFVKVVCQTPDEFLNKGPITDGHDGVDNVHQNSKDADIDHSLLEEVIERQVAKLNQSYIKSLKEQIKTINENKLQLSRHIEDLKIDRDHLYKQLELSHDREKIALIREQQDFKEIKSLKNRLALLAAPGSSEMEIVIPDKAAYDTDIKPVICVAAAEEEVKDGEEQPDHEIFINAEREKPEKEKIEETNSEKANWVAEPFVFTEDEEVHGPETSVELQDLKYIESADSAAAVRLDDIVSQSFFEESTAKVDDESDIEDDPVPKYMVLGQEALEKKDYDNAIEYFLKVVDILPTAGTVVLNLADLYFLKKEYEASRKYAVQAQKLGEESAILLLEKINTVLAPNAGLPFIEKNGEEIAEDLIALEEGYNEGFEDLEDTIFIELAALNEAADSTDNATAAPVEGDVLKDDYEIIAKIKEDAREYMALGVKAARQKDYNKAVEHFSKAVEILPDSAADFFNLAVLNYRLKEYEPAYRYAQKAIDLGSPSAMQILEKIKQVMVADLKSPAVVEPGAEIEKIKSLQLAKKDESKAFFIESDATLDEFTKTEKQNQSDLAVDSSLRKNDAAVNDSFKLGLAALEKKEFRKAIEHFNKVVELLPNGIPSYIHLTKIHYSLGEYPQARIHAKKAFVLGDYTLKPILEKIDAKLAEESARPSTEPMELKEQETPGEAIEETEAVSKASPGKKKEKPLVEDAPIETEEAKPEHIIGAQSELQNKEPKETIAHGKTDLKQAQDLVEPPGTIQPAAVDEFASETLHPATSPQTENPQVPREYGSVDEYFKAGLAASERDDFNIALEYFNKVAIALPKVPSSFLNMADLHYRMKNYKTARKHAERALELGAHSAHRILSKIEDSLEVKSS